AEGTGRRRPAVDPGAARGTGPGGRPEWRAVPALGLYPPPLPAQPFVPAGGTILPLHPAAFGLVRRAGGLEPGRRRGGDHARRGAAEPGACQGRADGWLNSATRSGAARASSAGSTTPTSMG